MLNGQITKRWIYQDQLTPAAEVDSVGNVVTRFAPGYIMKGDSSYALITDHLGSVKMVVNIATGSVRQRLDYDEYGNVIMNTNPDFQPFGYAGGLYDDATKLVRFGARDYSAKEGRWTSKDPINFEGRSSNLFEYVINDPVNKFDRNGLQTTWTNPGAWIDEYLKSYWNTVHEGIKNGIINGVDFVTNTSGDLSSASLLAAYASAGFVVTAPASPYLFTISKTTGTINFLGQLYSKAIGGNSFSYEDIAWSLIQILSPKIQKKGNLSPQEKQAINTVLDFLGLAKDIKNKCGGK